MNFKKLFVILLALLVVFSFVACDGGGGGSDDNGSTNGGNGGNGGDNGGGGEDDPPAVTWPVRYLTDNPEVEGSYFYIDFKEDETFDCGETDGSIIGTTSMGGGAYSGLDPHGDGTITMSGNFGVTSLEEGNYIITDGVLSLFGMNWSRQDD